MRSAKSQTSRTAYVHRIEDALGQRKLYWFGPRGADGRALLAIDQFDGAFSIMAPLEALSVRHDVSLERLKRHRVDHNTYVFEADATDALAEFRSRLLSVLSKPSAIVPYRPNRFLSNICFPRVDTAWHLGLFHEHQSQFEHKPWVESELKRIGVRTLPWIYLADEDKSRLVEFFEAHGQIVLRASRSDGGARVELITSPIELVRHMPAHDDGFLCACKFFDRAVPLNLNCCIFRDGTVLTHGLSEQLIGLPQLTRRRFGYCGNVFRPGDYWPRGLIQQLEHSAQLTGRWLHSQGYIGIFGIDALFVDGHVYLVEVNPRFQGSTWAMGRMDVSEDRLDHYVLHIAALAGLPAPPHEPLAEATAQQTPLTQAITHNGDANVAFSASASLTGAGRAIVDLVPEVGTTVHPDAIIARMIVEGDPEIGRQTVIELAAGLSAAPEQPTLFEGV